jgi:hypothetical protein
MSPESRGVHETHVCRDCGAEITLPYASSGGRFGYIEEGPRLAAAMMRVWRLSGRPDPFAGDRAGTRPGWEAFGLMVAAALEAPEAPKAPMPWDVAAAWRRKTQRPLR